MSSLLIYSGKVVTPCHVLDGGYVVIEDSRIAALGCGPPPICDESFDASGLWVLPGFVDLHCHGGSGHSFHEPDSEAIRTILRTHARGGTTSLLPTIGACPQEERHAALHALSNVADTTSGLPQILGSYLEGPYFSETERGAQPLHLLGAPDPTDYRATLTEFGAFIKIWSLAPELPGALDFIRELRTQGCVPALGHTNASEETIAQAVTAGASLVTHLYCAQSTFHRLGAEKKLGLAEMGLLLDALTVEIIADGKHLPPRLLQLILKCKPPSQVCLITDAMPATGMPPGEYTFLGDTVWVTPEVAYRADRQRYAGSVLTMARALANAQRAAEVSLPALAKMASLTPATLVGVADRKGSLEIGKDADLVLLDQDYRVAMTIVQGVIVYTSRPLRGRKKQHITRRTP
ncbi:MAG: N-acetylglucosamine-6-phosphate deacetylase [Candidatus Zipacnadales bacterium]